MLGFNQGVSTLRMLEILLRILKINLWIYMTTMMVLEKKLWWDYFSRELEIFLSLRFIFSALVLFKIVEFWGCDYESCEDFRYKKFKHSQNNYRKYKNSRWISHGKREGGGVLKVMLQKSRVTQQKIPKVITHHTSPFIASFIF